ncbi:MAG: CRISPR system precrRNA processing endoribonuclease RAMP protein Cas6 [Deltaproteobacteria bacterium]|nr:CRISPR system precrRNA processing endoribonuclease RAMP protein Cas6 [Deltaproteobacteria bacterium]
MLYSKHLFSSVFEDNAILPPYKGSTFRGVFGQALKKVVCALKKQDCKECLLREKCVYSFVFETPAIENELNEKRIASPPHPYVIAPPESTKTLYRKGEPFEFSLLLFGRANDYLPYFIYAFDQTGKLGIGKRIEGRRTTFLLKIVTADNKAVYSNDDKKIRAGQFTQDLVIDDSFSDKSAAMKSLELTLRTPLRLKFQNKLEAALPFHILTRAMLRRISSLNQYHGDGEPPLDYRGLVKRAKSVEIKKTSLKWFDWKRYSNKQDQSMLMGGMVGRVTYSGNLAEFLPLIRFCEKVHIGKQTSFGLGKIELTEE